MIKNIFRHQQKALYCILAVYAAAVWWPVLDFEFLRAYEPLWLGGAKQGFDFVEMYKSHSYFYYLDYVVFGWDPRGWYLTGLITHILGVLAFTHLVKRICQEFRLEYDADAFSFIFGLLFIGSFVYLDAVSWGSFNSYYGVLLLTMSVTVSRFLKYQKERKTIHFVLSCLSFLVALFLRETAVFALALIASIVILRDFDQWIDRKGWAVEARKLFLQMLPFAGVIVLFFAFRQAIGGVTGDMNDENVRGRLILLANKEYAELGRRIFHTFFRNAATLFFSFDWLNLKKAYLMQKYGNPEFVLYYFFSTVGFVAYSVFSAVCVWRLKTKRTPIAKLMVLAWVIITVSLLLIAVAIPAVDSVIASDYNLFTRRYNYFAFLGVSILLALVFIGVSKRFRAQGRVLAMLLLLYLGWNYGVLNRNLTKVYQVEHAEYKKFISEFRQISPDFRQDKLIYYHPRSSDINDFLLALGLTRSHFFPGSADSNSVNVEMQVDRVFQKLSEGRASIDNVLFLTYSHGRGLINYTPQMLELYKRKTKIPLIKNQVHLFAESQVLPSEVPFAIEFEQSVRLPSVNASTKFADFMEWYKDGAVAAGPTLSQRIDEPFLFCQAANAIDFNDNQEFVWCGDGYSNWIEVSSPAKTEVHGLWLMAPSKNDLPSQYEIKAIDSQQNERTVAFQEVIKPWGLEIHFKEPLFATKIKLQMKSTYQNYPLISEFNVMTRSIKKELAQGRPMPKVLEEIKAEGSRFGFWVTLEWVLSDGKTEVKKNRSQFIPFSEKAGRHRVSILESEFRTDTLDKFLKFHYKSVLVKFPKEAVDGIKNLNFISKY